VGLPLADASETINYKKSRRLGEPDAVWAAQVVRGVWSVPPEKNHLVFETPYDEPGARCAARSVAGLAPRACSVVAAQYLHGVRELGWCEGVLLETGRQKKFAHNHVVKLILYSRTNVNFEKKLLYSFC